MEEADVEGTVAGGAAGSRTANSTPMVSPISSIVMHRRNILIPGRRPRIQEQGLAAIKT
jgi:hypothetical protein